MNIGILFVGMLCIIVFVVLFCIGISAFFIFLDFLGHTIKLATDKMDEFFKN